MFREKAQDKDTDLSLNNLYPMPEELEKTEQAPVNWQNYLRNGITQLNADLDLASREDFVVKGLPAALPYDELAPGSAYDPHSAQSPDSAKNRLRGRAGQFSQLSTRKKERDPELPVKGVKYFQESLFYRFLPHVHHSAVCAVDRLSQDGDDVDHDLRISEGEGEKRIPFHKDHLGLAHGFGKKEPGRTGEGTYQVQRFSPACQ